MPDLYLIFSHELTNKQKKEAYETLGAKLIHYLPEKLSKLWSNVSPDMPKVSDHIKPIIKWLESRVKEGDYILVQGDFGATYIIVKWAFSKKCIPLYATTNRKINETFNEEKIIVKREFEHVRFRLYENLYT